MKGMWVIEYRLQKADHRLASLEAARIHRPAQTPAAGSISRPDPTHIVAGDGTWTLAQPLRTHHPGGPATNPKHRYDPQCLVPLPGKEKGHGYCML